ncbi:hypothetical protein [Streptococcus suis]|uniref:hypothetical protein n=1 Tax=Streptococcus suis TaxID=1307 RepID=UPI000CCC25D1|nr:hypothetical protein [Streptococcus suis]
MEKTQIIQDVLALIQDLNRAFQADKVGTADEQRFQHNLTETTRILGICPASQDACFPSQPARSTSSHCHC